MYYEDDGSCNEEENTLKQFREIIQNNVNTTERRNAKYHRKTREGKQSELKTEEENLEERKHEQKLERDIDVEYLKMRENC